MLKISCPGPFDIFQMNGDYDEEEDEIEDEITSESDTDSEGKGEELLMINVCCDFLHPSQQFFSHVMTVLPGLNQYKAADKVSCSSNTTQ